MALAMEIAGKTDVGCVRANNEDNFGYDSRYGIFVVCDGMGGQAAGEVASKMGVDILLDYFRQGAKLGPGPQVGSSTEGASASANCLANAIHLANRSIYQAGQQENGRSGMGSTISRIYLMRQGAIQQLTQDHSLVMEQVRRGYITLEQAQQSDMQNIILRALGSEEAVEPDIEDLVAVPGDVLLMTSDGLTRHVHDEEILQIVTGAADLNQACNALVQAAKDRGGDDNITCLLVRIVERSWYQNIFSKLFFGGPQWQNSI